MSLTFEIKNDDRQTLLTLTGYIDETSQLSNITFKAPSAQLIFDLSGIRHINSMGLRNWTIWIKSLPKFSGGFCFRNCPPVVVHQINVLQGFLPSGSIVESVQVPFHCDSCGNEWKELALRGRDYHERTADSDEKLPNEISRTCTKCNAKVHADILTEKYFNFLKHRK